MIKVWLCGYGLFECLGTSGLGYRCKPQALIMGYPDNQIIFVLYSDRFDEIIEMPNELIAFSWIRGYEIIGIL